MQQISAFDKQVDKQREKATNLTNRDIPNSRLRSKPPFKSQESELKSMMYPMAHMNAKEDANIRKSC